MIEFIGPLYNLLTTVHKLSLSSDWTFHGNYSDFQLNCQLLLASSYISLGSDRNTENYNRCLEMDIYEPTQKTPLATTVPLLRVCIASLAWK
jgi:hypothetical protein